MPQAATYLPDLTYWGQIYPRFPLIPVVVISPFMNLARPQAMSWAVKSRLITMLADLNAGPPPPPSPWPPQE